jgi:transcriptional regulator with XRE-family HTH domain
MRKDSTAAIELGSIRSALGMTQEAFAKELGVAQGVVSSWEGGQYAPSAENYMRLGNLAEERKLYLKAQWCFEQAGGRRMAMLAAAAYKQGYIVAQESGEHPNDPTAWHRSAMRFQKRILRRKAKKKE